MKSSRSLAPESITIEGYEGHFDELDHYTVGFETYTADADLAPMFAGLPDDMCQCPHWGYVLQGKLTYRYADGTEDTMESGNAYYARPGHTPVLFAGTQVVEFSPTAELQQTLDVVNKNMEAGAS
jgi:hypothetical protein